MRNGNSTSCDGNARSRDVNSIIGSSTLTFALTDASALEKMTLMRPLIIGSEVFFILCVFCSSVKLKHGEHGESHTQ